MRMVPIVHSFTAKEYLMHASVRSRPLDVVVSTFIVVVHAVALAVVSYALVLFGYWLYGRDLLPAVTPYLFSWGALWTAVFFKFFSGLGITVGFHRLLTHAGFSTYAWVKRAWGIAGMSALQGSVPEWIAVHREHHELSDQEGDPHSPRDGWWWSHVLWLFAYFTSEEKRATIKRYAPDMMKDPFFAWWHDRYWLVPVLMALGIAGIGYAYAGLPGASSFLLWAFFVRVVLVWNVTWFVNSATHTWGYRTYDTDDNSRNCWWVGILAYGEGWHNNHHAHPRLAVHGHNWWEFDLSYWVIRFLRLIRLAKDVKDTIPRQTSP